LLAVTLLDVCMVEAVEAALELDLVTEEEGRDAESFEVVAGQERGLVGDTEGRVGLVPCAAVEARLGLLEIIPHPGT
jgi:hypothetical protein